MRTRTSRSPRCTRCSHGSTTGSSGCCPSSLSNEQKFQIARRVVGAEEQYITYNEFLPAMGVRLAPYRGYDPHVNASLSTEFATVGYRMHSMVHGEFDIDVPAGTYSRVAAHHVRDEGIDVQTAADGTIELTVPLTLAFGNPDLLQQIGEGPLARRSRRASGSTRTTSRSTTRCAACSSRSRSREARSRARRPSIDPNCFMDVSDLGAIDVQRGRDHGIPCYNDLRKAYGLQPVQLVHATSPASRPTSSRRG